MDAFIIGLIAGVIIGLVYNIIKYKILKRNETKSSSGSLI